MKKILASIAVAAYVVLCLVVDFLPYKGPPRFRYTGSDPNFDVWNIGWPLGTAIYDPRNGWHWGPEAFLFLPLQVMLLVAAIAAWFAWRWWKNR